MKRVLATALTVATMCVIGGDSKPPIHADEVEFSLISYLETHEIDSYEEFTEIIQTHSVVSTDEIRRKSHISIMQSIMTAELFP